MQKQLPKRSSDQPTMRFVLIKTDDQVDLQALHRVCDVLAWSSIRSSTNGTKPLGARTMAYESIWTQSPQRYGCGLGKQNGSNCMGDLEYGNKLLRTNPSVTDSTTGGKIL
jgi:hypothetical protein